MVVDLDNAHRLYHIKQHHNIPIYTIQYRNTTKFETAITQPIFKLGAPKFAYHTIIYHTITNTTNLKQQVHNRVGRKNQNFSNIKCSTSILIFSQIYDIWKKIFFQICTQFWRIFNCNTYNL